jgi:di/tricarboxylate transporter
MTQCMVRPCVARELCRVGGERSCINVSGLWLEQLGLIWTFAAGGKLFAYQSGVLIVGYSYGYFEARDLVKIGAWLTVVEFVVLMLLVPFYWPLLGIH